MNVVLAVLGMAVLAGAVAYAGVGAVNDLASRRRQRRFAALAADLTVVLLGDEQEAETRFHRLSRQPTELLLGTLLGLSIDLEGKAAQRLRDVAERSGGLHRVLRLAGSRLWRRRLQGAHLSGLLGPADTQRLRLLGDRVGAVRAVAAECLDPQTLAAHPGLVAELLGDPEPAVVAATQRVLIRSSQLVRPALIACLSAPATRRAALEVLAKLADPTLAETAAALADVDEPNERALVAEALGRQGTTSADALLVLLADDAPAVRATAASAVATAGLTVLAGHVGRLLADRAWSVRRAAADALAELGVGGEMVLRTYLRHADPFARDMAQQTLDTLERRRVGLVA